MTHHHHGLVHGVRQWFHWLFLPKHGLQKWEFIIGAVMLGVLVLFLLDRFLNSRRRRRFVLTLTFIAGFYYALEYLLPGHGPNNENFLTAYIDPVGFAWAVVGAFAFSLGMINLGRIHGKQVATRARGYHNSVAFFLALLGTMVIGFVYQYDQNNGVKNGIYHIMFDGFLQPLGASMFATLGFYITSAAYRVFRIRSREALIMLIAGFIVMLGQVPVGALLTGWIRDNWAIAGFHFANLRFERLAYWILTVPNAAAVRAIGFGIEVGGVAMGLRLWMSLERGSYFDKEF
jgi:hypothetical protein